IEDEATKRHLAEQHKSNSRVTPTSMVQVDGDDFYKKHSIGNHVKDERDPSWLEYAGITKSLAANNGYELDTNRDDPQSTLQDDSDSESANLPKADSPTAIQPEKESNQEEMVYADGGDNEDKIDEAVEAEGGDNDDRIASSCCLIIAKHQLSFTKSLTISGTNYLSMGDYVTEGTILLKESQ
ncbi:hypothetical protein Tco_0809282, partial [Tanacetum coccineum]